MKADPCFFARILVLNYKEGLIMLVLKILFIVLNTAILVLGMWEDIADDLRYRFKDNSRILKFLRLKPPKKKDPFSMITTLWE